MKELTKEEQIQAIYDLKVGYTLGHADIAMLKAMASQLLAGLEQEPVYQVLGDGSWTDYSKQQLEDLLESKPSTLFRVAYAAPQLPQPAVVMTFDEWSRKCDLQLELCDSDLREKARYIWDEACRSAMLQGAEPAQDVDNTNRQFESLGCAEDTARRFKCTGLIVTSDERKMEIPHCSKHPETELQVHPFEQLMSYPPRPVMYCPLCRPSVAEWVALDKQLRRQRNGK